MLPTPFEWDADHIAIDLGDGARALFTTRRGGVSAAPFDSLNLGFLTDDEPGSVEANYATVADLVGVDRAALAQGRQVHGAEVLINPTARDEADAVVVDEPGRAAIVLTADCLPIALANRRSVAMVHGGWKGLAAGVIEAAVAAMPPDGPITAAIGPSAAACCYEVGDDVRAALGEDPCGEPRTIDLRRYATERLYDAEVDVVHDVDLCTMCTDPRLFFSHRRDGPATGRQGGIAWRPNR
jgi:YfiH family protein